MDADADTGTGYALHAREPVIVNDGDADTRFSVPAILRAHGVRSGIAARIAGVRRPVGVVAAYSTTPRTFTAEDAQFVSGVAVALAGMFERKRVEHERAELASREKAERAAADLAARRAAFLAQTATVFDTALEPEATLVCLARLAVPSLAECAIVDFVHEEGSCAASTSSTSIRVGARRRRYQAAGPEPAYGEPLRARDPYRPGGAALAGPDRETGSGRPIRSRAADEAICSASRCC